MIGKTRLRFVCERSFQSRSNLSADNIENLEFGHIKKNRVARLHQGFLESLPS
jgi:hypothetical protein